jgi:hypothetical protein
MLPGAVGQHGVEQYCVRVQEVGERQRRTGVRRLANDLESGRQQHQSRVPAKAWVVIDDQHLDRNHRIVAPRRSGKPLNFGQVQGSP